MLTFSGWNFWGSFSGVAKEQGVNLILNSFFGPMLNASRGIAYQVAGALKSFVSTVMISGRPQLTQAYAQNNFARVITLMYSLSKASFIILLLFSIPIIFNISYILHIWLSTELPNETKVFVNLVIVMSLIESLSPPVSFVVHASGKMAKYQLINSFIILLILPTSYTFLKLGANAVSVFWLGVVFQILCQISSVIILKGIISYPISDYVKIVVCPLLVIALIASIIAWSACCMVEEGFLRLLFVSGLSTISIALSTYLFALSKNEKSAITLSLKNRLKHD